MNAYIFTFALICEALAMGGSMEHCDVGTVLFPRSALNKKSWSVAQISILRARKSFLDIIPPINVLNTRSADFSDKILSYFKESFAEVKNEAMDSETDSLLTLALSDAVGGYLKMWVLPITKFAYYGGTVPTEDALNLYRFQDNLKRHLKTDGKGWRNPPADFLYSMSIDIAPVCQDPNAKSLRPCEDIAYFERTKNGLAIPVPSISWEKDYECIFFPIKNQAPVSLNVPDSNDSLIKFYNTARNCIITSNLEDLDHFEERFQKWLDTNVIPHLRDEKLYPALRSVLSLINKSRIFEATVYMPLRNRTYIGGIPVDLSSKKMMVITIIIILEIAWCIPTLCYLMFTRMKDKKNKIKLYYKSSSKKSNFGKPREGWICSACTITNVANTASKQVSASPSVQSCACLNEQKRSFNVDVETCFPQTSQNSIGTATRSNFKCQLHPTQIITNDQAIGRKPSKQLAAPLGKLVSIKISNHSSSDKMSGSNIRPHLTPVYDSTHSKTSVNSFTRYKIKKASSSFIHNSCCCKKASSSSTMKGSWGNCNTPSSSFIQCTSCLMDNNPGSSQPINKDSTLNKKNSASSLLKASFCNCECRRDPQSFIRTSCNDSNCECFNCIPEEEMASTTGSLITVQNLQPTQTVTLLQDSMLSVNDTKTSSYIKFPVADKKESQNINKEEKKVKKSVTISSVAPSPELVKLQPEPVANTNCNSKQDKGTKKCVTIASFELLQKPTDSVNATKKPPCKQIQSLAIEKASKETMIYVAHKVNRHNSQKESSSNKKDLKPSKPVLQITIDRSLPFCTPASPAKFPKPSKIPKRFLTNTVTQTKSSKVTHSYRKSLIPKRKRHFTVDDIVIQKKSSLTSENDKMNVTL